MEDRDLIGSWNEYSRKLDESLRLNRQNAEDLTKIKIKTLLSSMASIKIFAVLVGLVWVIVGSYLLTNLIITSLDKISTFFLISAGVQLSVTAVAVAVYLNQLIQIQGVDPEDPVLITQKRVLRLKSLTLWSVRILALQLPVWTTFYWNETMFREWGLVQWLIQIAVTTLFASAALWIFVNVKIQNCNEKWFVLIFNGDEWNSIVRSEELLAELDEFEAADD